VATCRRRRRGSDGRGPTRFSGGSST
jgi:hypothetical protein